jgi:hypothetical protein
LSPLAECSSSPKITNKNSSSFIELKTDVNITLFREDILNKERLRNKLSSERLKKNSILMLLFRDFSKNMKILTFEGTNISIFVSKLDEPFSPVIDQNLPETLLRIFMKL